MILEKNVKTMFSMYLAIKVTLYAVFKTIFAFLSNAFILTTATDKVIYSMSKSFDLVNWS